MVSRYLSLAALLIGLAAVSPVKAANWLEKNFWLSGPNYDGAVPACDAALDRIVDRFAQKESEFWNSNLRIVEIDRVRQVAFSPWARGTIPRRFCRAMAKVSDGHWHPVYYWIGEDTGMIGASWGVEWCVVGLDRNWAYNPACKMALP